MDWDGRGGDGGGVGLLGCEIVVFFLSDNRGSMHQCVALFAIPDC